MKTIQLTQGKVALVDDEDYEMVDAYKWSYHHNGYAVTNWNKAEGRMKFLSMHRLILGELVKGKVTDHINGNGIDNRRENLRVCSQGENTFNQKKSKSNTSGYKGVFLQGRKWKTQIRIKGKIHYIGYFSDKVEAAKAYNEAAKIYHGEFSRLNTI